MLGSSVSIPYDLWLFRLLLALAALLLIGAVSSPAWLPIAATFARRGALLLAIVAIAFVLIRTPTRDPFISLGRVFTIWCPFAAAALFYGIWCWRAGRW